MSVGQLEYAVGNLAGALVTSDFSISEADVLTAYFGRGARGREPLRLVFGLYLRQAVPRKNAIANCPRVYRGYSSDGRNLTPERPAAE